MSQNDSLLFQLSDNWVSDGSELHGNYSKLNPETVSFVEKH